MTGRTVELLLLANLTGSLLMTGLIWFVQVVHYPLFAKVGSREFVDYEGNHTRLTTFVVGPPMLLEALSSLALLLVAQHNTRVPLWAAWAGISLVAINWLSTAALQVPCHNRLQKCFETDIQKRLVRTNWIRTIAWTLKSALALYVI